MSTLAIDRAAKAPKTDALAALVLERHGKPIRRMIVVGCGSGREAASLRHSIGCEVVGIDIVADFDPAAAACVTLEQGDATALGHADGAFDFVYSFHALEHIPDFRRALREMRRVLGDGGGYCIGTPNRARLVGYLGSQGTPWLMKLQWNAADWNARLHGRFRNEFGAHAGFTRRELAAELGRVFSATRDVTHDYYRRLYATRARSVDLLQHSGLGGLLFPSVYFIGPK
jgi:SAM-dependent methyltransferase